MHVLESFATSCGLKINRPYIYEKYYPLNIEKYIVLETNDSKYQAKNYDYWQEVVNLIQPELKKNNIHILQLCGQNDTRITNAYTIVGHSNNQKAFLIKNSLLYVGTNNLGISFASFYSKKIVALFGNVFANQGKPYWSEDKDVSLIEGFRVGEKPSYHPTEQIKTINNIMPNKIAKSILDKLNLSNKINFKYINIGNNFNNKTIEIVPNMVVDPKVFNLPHLIIRMDLEFNENVLEKTLEISKCLIVTNKSISPEIIKKYQKNIVQVFYKIDDNNDPNFIKLLKSLNIQYILASYLSDEQINKLKIDYMDLGLIIRLSKNNKDNFKEEIKYYKSNSFIISNSKLYISEAALEKDLPIKNFNDNIQKVIDIDRFWMHADKYAFLVD